jgi:hypothetical protein
MGVARTKQARALIQVDRTPTAPCEDVEHLQLRVGRRRKLKSRPHHALKLRLVAHDQISRDLGTGHIHVWQQCLEAILDGLHCACGLFDRGAKMHIYSTSSNTPLWSKSCLAMMS